MCVSEIKAKRDENGKWKQQKKRLRHTMINKSAKKKFLLQFNFHIQNKLDTFISFSSTVCVYKYLHNDKKKKFCWFVFFFYISI